MFNQFDLSKTIYFIVYNISQYMSLYFCLFPKNNNLYCYYIYNTNHKCDELYKSDTSR